METVDQLRKELEFYKKKFSLAEEDVAIKGYMAYVALVKQQVDYVSDFQIKSNIDGKKTETVIYDRSIALWESLPNSIMKLNQLKFELGITYDPEAGKPKPTATTPESMILNR